MVRLPRWVAVCVLVIVGATGCPQRVRRHSTDGVVASGTDTFPTDFTPPPPLAPAGPADPATFGAAYLDQLAARIEPGWTQFLEDCRLRLPPSHPLNSPTLEASLALAIDSHGAVAEVSLAARSGNQEFDDAVLGVADDAAPFPAPPRAFLSDDDRAYVTWRFGRDQRQAGAATASLTRVEWPLERSVPKFLDDGNLAEAARRVAKAAGADANAVALGFGERVMIAAVREGLASADAGVQRLAIAAAAAAQAKTAARELRAIADGAMDVELRGAAIDALAAIGDTDAAPLLVTILERDAGANLELTARAAHALAVLDAKADVARVVAGWLAAGKADKTPADGAKTWAALIAASGAPVPSAVGEIGKLATSAEPRVRGAVCRALGAAATADGAAWKPLGRGLADPDASVRATCAGAIAEAAAAGATSRATFWLLAPMLRDRDERARAAAVLALGRLDAKRGKDNLVALAKDKSALVQASLAEALVRAGELDRAAALLAHAEVAVRLAAATALATLGGPAGAAKLIGHVDADPGVRIAIIAATTDKSALATAASDADPAVAAAAIRRLVVVSGRGATLAGSATVVADAAPGSAIRVQAAGAWLAAR